MVTVASCIYMLNMFEIEFLSFRFFIVRYLFFVFGPTVFMVFILVKKLIVLDGLIYVDGFFIS